MQIIYFDDDDKGQSYTRGAWTPRKDVAALVLKVIESGAKTVVAWFDFDVPTPLIYREGTAYSDDEAFLLTLRDAAETARRRNAVIILPAFPNTPSGTDGRFSSEYTAKYRKMIRQYNDVVKQASPSIVIDYGGVVRAFSFLTTSSSEVPKPTSTLALSAFLYQRYGRTPTDGLLRQYLLPPEEDAAEKASDHWLPRAVAASLKKEKIFISYRLLQRDVVNKTYHAKVTARYGYTVRKADEDIPDPTGKQHRLRRFDDNTPQILGAGFIHTQRHS